MMRIASTHLGELLAPAPGEKDPDEEERELLRQWTPDICCVRWKNLGPGCCQGFPIAPVDCEGFLNFVFACMASSILTSNINDQCNARLGSLGIYHFPGEQRRTTHILENKIIPFWGPCQVRSFGWSQVHVYQKTAENMWPNSHWHETLSGLSDCMFLSM